MSIKKPLIAAFFYTFVWNFRTHVFCRIVKLNLNSIAMIENISIVFQLFLSLTMKSQFIKKVDFSEFGIYNGRI
jgi:hypothetical protein